MRATLHPTGFLMLSSHAVRAAWGRTGVRGEGKREGDGATPAGLLPLRQVLYRPDRVAPPHCAVPVQPLRSTDGWCDDPAHDSYNRLVQLPLDGSAETLWRDDPLYDIIGVLGWNDSPVLAGLGSAIFLHLARPDFTPTDGCIALALDDLQTVLASGLTEILVMT